MTESSDYESVQVFIGVDVGKDTHHAVAINRSGKRLFDKALPNDENKLRSLISDLKQHGQILLVVDQPATIGALPVGLRRAQGSALQGLLHPQNESGKTTQSGAYRPGETTLRRSVRHDARRDFLYPAGVITCLTT